tara:strand:+ start:574 stop:723 length:150 start_codon:yes stop_codon:yes gene_type:complete
MEKKSGNAPTESARVFIWNVLSQMTSRIAAALAGTIHALFRIVFKKIES